MLKLTKLAYLIYYSKYSSTKWPYKASQCISASPGVQQLSMQVPLK